MLCATVCKYVGAGLRSCAMGVDGGNKEAFRSFNKNKADAAGRCARRKRLKMPH